MYSLIAWIHQLNSSHHARQKPLVSVQPSKTISICATTEGLLKIHPISHMYMQDKVSDVARQNGR